MSSAVQEFVSSRTHDKRTTKQLYLRGSSEIQATYLSGIEYNATSAPGTDDADEADETNPVDLPETPEIHHTPQRNELHGLPAPRTPSQTRSSYATILEGSDVMEARGGIAAEKNVLQPPSSEDQTSSTDRAYENDRTVGYVADARAQSGVFKESTALGPDRDILVTDEDPFFQGMSDSELPDQRGVIHSQTRRNVDTAPITAIQDKLDTMKSCTQTFALSVFRERALSPTGPAA